MKEVDVAEFLRVADALRQRADTTLVESGAETTEVPPAGFLVVSADPPTLAIALPTDSVVTWEAMLSRRIFLRAASAPADDAVSGPRLDTSIVRWVPGGRNTTLFILAVTGTSESEHSARTPSHVVGAGR